MRQLLVDAQQSEPGRADALTLGLLMFQGPGHGYKGRSSAFQHWPSGSDLQGGSVLAQTLAKRADGTGCAPRTWKLPSRHGSSKFSKGHSWSSRAGVLLVCAHEPSIRTWSSSHSSGNDDASTGRWELMYRDARYGSYTDSRSQGRIPGASWVHRPRFRLGEGTIGVPGAKKSRANA